MIKILHAADFHLDSPHRGLSAEKAAARRGEQRSLLRHMFSVAKEESVDIILLAGDLLDSDNAYYETTELLLSLLGGCKANIFIAPGNHDFYGQSSPYKVQSWPDNVHIFTSGEITAVTLPELGVRVYGAAFTSPETGPSLTGFITEKDELINIMVLHAPLRGNRYNPLDTKDITASKLHYLALGHVHTYSGILKSGRTFYAYPGCPEGRGFDETGEKGFLLGTVTKSKAELEFVPSHGRRYEIFTIKLNDESPHLSQIRSSIPAGNSGNILRLILTGEVEKVDINEIQTELENEYFSVELEDRTTLPYSLWTGMGELTLRGIALKGLYDLRENAPNDDLRDDAELAARYLLSAIDNREVPRL